MFLGWKIRYVFFAENPPSKTTGTLDGSVGEGDCHWDCGGWPWESRAVVAQDVDHGLIICY